ncbi:histidine kinase [Dulcicalothrix desertica PCC 7102]|uniref:histidine kinase n=1 Tax=Dulcicalothrix desertica PCC 7102 TaxID=232991 RepID=A0A433VKH5_9CYAN|nr:PAS domain-containing sensor histidine kinase [Dulcicalothrix desertica]RUT06590.1 histidine kinase [Dulcicalothrix desertica PCC 7102]TWH50299.1 PAS domain S-box-containing protein [Dulcicalothrix desertica PCC 7102]
MQAGANDFVSKGRLKRLIPAIERSLREAENNRQRQQAEKALKESEQKVQAFNERLTLALDAVQMGIWDWDIPTNETIWTPYHEIILGYTPGTPQRSYAEWANRVHPEDLPQVEMQLQAAIAQKRNWEQEYRIIHPNGSLHWVTSRGRIYYNDVGQAMRMVGIIIDITEKKQLETQFLRAQRLENLGILASGIAHDLNNILTPILATAQLLPVTIANLSDRNRHYLNILETSTRRGADLVQQILSFARGTEDKRLMLQVKHLLLDIEKVIKSTFPKFIELEKNINYNLWTVNANATQLHQVFMNLVINARDAMPNGGTLNLSATNIYIDETYNATNPEAQIGAYVVVSVSDTGTGIPPDIIEKIFDPFFTTKEVGKGTGLGLSTVFSIIKKHGGFIEVSSTINQGSCFKVYLPATTTANEQLNTEDFELPKGNGELILLVDDEIAIGDITKTTLEAYNYTVLLARNGMEAIASYVQYKNTIKLVLMDIHMPSVDGKTAIITLQKINSQVPIIAMSGSKDGMGENPQINYNELQGFLPKPFTVYELLTILQNVLHS